jgi:hypothetical protein
VLLPPKEGTILLQLFCSGYQEFLEHEQEHEQEHELSTSTFGFKEAHALGHNEIGGLTILPLRPSRSGVVLTGLMPESPRLELFTSKADSE